MNSKQILDKREALERQAGVKPANAYREAVKREKHTTLLLIAVLVAGVYALSVDTYYSNKYQSEVQYVSR